MKSAFSPADLLPVLPDRFQKGQAFDVTDRTPDLGDDHVVIRGQPLNRAFDRVGDMGNHLHGRAQIVPAALPGDHILVDAAGGDVVGLRERLIDEALVMTQIQIRLRPVVGDEDLAVLKGGKRAGIDVDVGIELLHRHAQAPLDQQTPQRGRGNPLPQRRDHTAGHEDVLGGCNVRLGHTLASEGKGDRWRSRRSARWASAGVSTPPSSG